MKEKEKRNKGKDKREEEKTMRVLKENKGITLIALVVTIIVLLILAGVTIALVLGQNGIFKKAETAAENTNSSQELEQVRLAVLEARTNNLTGGDDLKTELKNSINKIYPGSEVAENGDKSYTITLPNRNEYVVSEKGHVSKEESVPPQDPVDTVKIPEGFIHKEGDTREEGIVVADKAGNEYVWVPVTKDEAGNPTKPYEATNGELNGKVIQLQRKYFRIEEEEELGTSLTEDTKESHNKDCDNAIAEDITAFKESVMKNGGYFFGRYEAGIEGGIKAENLPVDAPDKNWTGWTGGTLVCKKDQQVWNFVTQNKASELCRNIDTEKRYIGVKSDLVNGYAWDTAIVFIQTCGTESNSRDYANQLGLEKDYNRDYLTTGTAILADTNQADKQCNIYDMAGNCSEWSTETYSHSFWHCVNRGCDYNNGGISSYLYSTCSYRAENAIDIDYSISFRPLLYWNS